MNRLDLPVPIPPKQSIYLPSVDPSSTTPNEPGWATYGPLADAALVTLFDVVVGEGDRTQIFQVSALLLSLASPVWEDDIKQNQASGGLKYQLEDPIAFYYVFHVLHMKGHLVARWPTEDEMYRIARLAQKFKCENALRSWAHTWILLQNLAVTNLLYRVVISWTFGHRPSYQTFMKQSLESGAWTNVADENDRLIYKPYHENILHSNWDRILCIFDNLTSRKSRELTCFVQCGRPHYDGEWAEMCSERIIVVLEGLLSQLGLWPLPVKGEDVHVSLNQLEKVLCLRYLLRGHLACWRQSHPYNQLMLLVKLSAPVFCTEDFKRFGIEDSVGYPVPEEPPYYNDLLRIFNKDTTVLLASRKRKKPTEDGKELYHPNERVRNWAVTVTSNPQSPMVPVKDEPID